MYSHGAKAPMMTVLLLVLAAGYACADEVSTDLCTVSTGDAAVGISASTDAKCASGGLGCFSATCRFCKVFDSAQSSYLLSCPPITSAPAAAPSPTSRAQGTTPTVALTVASVPTATNACAVKVSTGDAAVGVSAVIDTTCQGGGLGCFSDACRYCKTYDTAQSSYLLSCPTNAPPPAPITAPAPQTQAVDCTSAVSSGDAAVGIGAVADSSCEDGGLGCFSASCRFCKVFDSTQSAYLISCISRSPAMATTTSSPTPPPTTAKPRVPAPTSTPPTAPPAVADDTTPSDGSSSAFDLTCRRPVTPGDASVGINIATDVSCTFGGVGCVSEVCRYCQAWTTSQSSNFIRCSDVNTNNGQDIKFAPLPVNGHDNGIIVGAMDRPVLSEIVIVDDPDSPQSIVIDTSVCASLVNAGDAATGISAIVDTSCQSGGLGCFSSTCRYCKEYNTEQSSYLQSCDYELSPPLQMMQAEPSKPVRKSGSFMWAVGGAMGSLAVAAVALFKHHKRSAREEDTRDSNGQPNEEENCDEAPQLRDTTAPGGLVVLATEQ